MLLYVENGGKGLLLINVNTLSASDMSVCCLMSA